MLENEYGLLLSPHLCLLAANEEHCELSLELSWRVAKSANYCLYQALVNKPLHCWQKANQANIKIELLLTDNTDFYLTDEQSKQTIVKASVQLQKQTQRYRRKRRTPWRFY